MHVRFRLELPNEINNQHSRQVVGRQSNAAFCIGTHVNNPSIRIDFGKHVIGSLDQRIKAVFSGLPRSPFFVGLPGSPARALRPRIDLDGAERNRNQQPEPPFKIGRAAHELDDRVVDLQCRQQAKTGVEPQPRPLVFSMKKNERSAGRQ